MNALLFNDGWITMDISIKDPATHTAVPSKVLFEGPVTPDNVDVKLWLMSVMLSCKYAEIVWWYVEAIRLILGEGRQATTLVYLRTTLQKIKKIRPPLMRMMSALTFVNYTDVTVTVSKFEHDLWLLITHMDAFYENREFVVEPLPQTLTRFFDLLSKLNESFDSAFQTYSLTVIEFVSGFCYVQFVPNRENFEHYHRQLQPLLPRKMGLCDFLTHCTRLFDPGKHKILLQRPRFHSSYLVTPRIHYSILLSDLPNTNILCHHCHHLLLAVIF
ncbi:uncharacterized protein LOC126844644 [Adelges cooleyi]|uniref:uncharacterized protein LOC126844644 n=1 Tax=Adelges cooleyi TaxID=133065 RepID=UPI0021807499|nr:uncharacterized protein LOC126844644 [Adelges cooleyi]XP_050438934.1 uncharacterized protein LOC126844644 [Adelges cooleyi]